MPDYPKLGHYIGGAWDYSTVSSRDVFDPATEEVLGLLPQASEVELDAALAAAQIGLQTWRNVVPFERSGIMREAANLVRERLDAIATALTLEQGKPIGEARLEVAVAADTIDWFAEEGRRA